MITELRELFVWLFGRVICFVTRSHDCDRIGKAPRDMQGELWTVYLWKCKRCGRISTNSIY